MKKAFDAEETTAVHHVTRIKPDSAETVATEFDEEEPTLVRAKPVDGSIEKSVQDYIDKK